MRTLLLIALASTTVAAAGQDSGSRIRTYDAASIPVSTKLTDEQAAQVTMNAYMACVVQRARRNAEQFAAAAPGSPEERRLVPKLATADCLSAGELRFKPALMRGGIYEALYRADYGKSPPAGLAGRAPVDYAAPASATAADQRAPLLAFGDCVSRADPSGTHALLMAAPATKSEGAAVAKLQPGLRACLPQGTTLRFSRPVLRGVIAETAYRLAKAPAAAPAVAAAPTPGTK